MKLLTNIIGGGVFFMFLLSIFLNLLGIDSPAWMEISLSLIPATIVMLFIKFGQRFLKMVFNF